MRASTPILTKEQLERLTQKSYKTLLSECSQQQPEIRKMINAYLSRSNSEILDIPSYVYFSGLNKV